MRNKIIFLSRAYNDIDCRLPLLLEFAKDRQFIVKVIGIPSGMGIHDPNKHELINLLKQKSVEVGTLFDLADKNIFQRCVYFLYRIAGQGRIGRIIFKALIFLFSRNNTWADKIFSSFESGIVLADEIVFQSGRSFILDKLLRKRKTLNLKIYSFITGQDPYLDLWRQQTSEYLLKTDEKEDIPIFLPGRNDLHIMTQRLPRAHSEVVGNTRFDASWVRELADISKKNIANNSALNKNAEKKIVFMLSKIEYGVDLDSIINVVNRCANVSGAQVIVKPHTRGMSLGDFAGRLNPKVIRGAVFSSSDLIQWADTVLFTGSTIVFQAMQLSKQVIFLKYCQRYATLFDESDALLVAEDLNDVIKFIDSPVQYRITTEKVNAFMREHVFNGIQTGLVCKSVKERILETEQVGV